MARPPDLTPHPAAAALACAVLLSGGHVAMAEVPRSASAMAFDIPAQPLGGALVAFSLAAREQVIVAPELVAGRVSRPVKGVLNPRDALTRLLAGSGLEAERTPGGVLMIRRAARPPAPAADEPGPADMADPVEVETLVVTSQLREQRDMETPLSLTALSGERLERLGVGALDQLAQFTPGLSVVSGSPASSGFSMRGITQASGDATREPRFSVFQDGLSVSKERGAYFELFDLERVEVAKGPQSTLFGRSAMTGALNVIQRKADPAGVDWSLRSLVSDRGGRTVDAMLNLPLGDGVAVRFAGRSRRRHGLTPNLAGGEALDSGATDAARLGFAWRSDGRVSGEAIFNYQRDRPSGMALKSLVFAPTDPRTGAVLGDLDRFSPPALSAVDADGAPRAPGLDRTLGSASLAATYQLGSGFKLSALAGYRRFYADELQDGDGMALPVVSVFEQTRGAQHSQDLRLAYEGGGRVTGFLGVGAFHESGSQGVPITVDERLLLARLSGGLVAPVPQALGLLTEPGFMAAQLQALAASRGYALGSDPARAISANLKPAYVERNQNYGRTTAYDLYADLTFRPAPTWELSAGLRYSFDRKTSAAAPSLPGGPSVLASAVQAFGMAEPQRSAFLAALAQPGYGQGPSSAWPAYGILFQPTAGDGAKVSRQLEDAGWSWRLVARYAASRDLSLYGSYARGRRPTVLVAGAPNQPYGPARFGVVPDETVDSLEVGAKGLLLDRRLRLDAAAYAYDYEDFQTTQLIDGALRTVNAGQASAYGLEIQGDWAFAPGQRLTLSYAYNHARLGRGVLEGDRFRLSPDHKLSAVLTLTHETAWGQVSFIPSYSWQSLIFFADDNDRPELSRGLVRDNVQDELQKGYGLLDLRLGLRPAGGRWELVAFCANALDRRYIKEGGFIGEAFGFSATSPGAPRLLGLSLTLRR